MSRPALVLRTIVRGVFWTLVAAALPLYLGLANMIVGAP